MVRLVTGRNPGGGASAPLITTQLVGPDTLDASMTFTRASVGYERSAGGVLVQRAANVPRFMGTARRLLIEGQRSNLRQSSSTPTDAYWGIGEAFNDANAGLSPDAITQMAALRPWATDQRHRVEVPFTPTPGVLYTRSVYLKYAGYHAQMYVGTLSGTNINVYFDLINGVVSQINSVGTVGMFTNHSAAIEAIGNGVYRCSQTFQTTETQDIYPGTAASDRLVSTGGNGALIAENPQFVSPDELGKFLWWGEVIEAGGPASSYVVSPSGAGATRAADVLIRPLSGAEAQRGTLVGTFMLPQGSPVGNNQGVLELHDGTANNRLAVFNPASTTTFNFRRVVGGVVGGPSGLGSFAPGVPVKLALSWDANGSSLAVSGAVVGTITGAPPPLTTLGVGSLNAGAFSNTFGEVGPLTLYSNRLPDSQLQTLTT